MPYGNWVKPERFMNFQDLYGVYLKKVKTIAYRLDDIIGTRVERLHEAGVDGYVIEGRTAKEVSEYLTAYALPKAQYKSGVKTAEFDLKANLIPGSVLVVMDGLDNVIVDKGNGVLAYVDGNKAGTIDYAAGKVVITAAKVVEAVGAGTANINAGFATTDSTVKFEAFKNTVTGLTEDVKVSALIGGQIPSSQVGYTLMLVGVNTSRKFFVGLTTESFVAQAAIIKAITGTTVTVATAESSVRN